VLALGSGLPCGAAGMRFVDPLLLLPRRPVAVVAVVVALMRLAWLLATLGAIEDEVEEPPVMGRGMLGVGSRVVYLCGECMDGKWNRILATLVGIWSEDGAKGRLASVFLIDVVFSGDAGVGWC
jgi:hypothetical protein